MKEKLKGNVAANNIKEVNPAEEKDNKLEALLNSIEYEDDGLNLENPAIKIRKATNTLTIFANDGNYIQGKLMLSRGQVKEYTNAGVDNFEINLGGDESSTVKMKEGVSLSEVTKIDKDQLLEEFLITKVVVDNNVQDIKQPNYFKDSSELLPLRNIYVKLVKKFNELGL